MEEGINLMSNHSMIQVFREHTVQYALEPFSVCIDEIHYGEIEVGGTCEVSINSGEHRIQIQGWLKETNIINFTVKPRQEKRFILSVGFLGDMKLVSLEAEPHL